MTASATEFSLADFFHGEGEDPLTPPEDFTWWRAETAWAASLYEPALSAAPVPRTSIAIEGSSRPVINLSSYNYLVPVKHPETIAAAQAALAEYGTGACGSPMLSGMTKLHRRLEERLSEFLGREAAILFNSGFGGAMGSLAGCLRKGDVAVIDNKSHFGLIAGVTLSEARLQTFEHSDPGSLNEVLTREQGKRRLVVVEGVYSMDGDLANLPALVEVAERHRASMLIDEAHSILTCGPHGRGVVEHFGLGDKIGLQYATFSKAFAGVGGFVSGRREIIDYLRCYSTPDGFSCALPPSAVAALLAGLEVATRDHSLRERLWANAEYFREDTIVSRLGKAT